MGTGKRRTQHMSHVSSVSSWSGQAPHHHVRCEESFQHDAVFLGRDSVAQNTCGSIDWAKMLVYISQNDVFAKRIDLVWGHTVLGNPIMCFIWLLLFRFTPHC